MLPHTWRAMRASVVAVLVVLEACVGELRPVDTVFDRQALQVCDAPRIERVGTELDRSGEFALKDGQRRRRRAGPLPDVRGQPLHRHPAVRDVAAALRQERVLRQQSDVLVTGGVDGGAREDDRLPER